MGELPVNPWTSILDPKSLIPKDRERGRLHILSDELDPTTLLVASKPGPKPPAATPEPTLPPIVRNWPGPTISEPIPRKAKPQPPGPAAYRVPKSIPLTYPQAILVRERARMRQPVAQYLLEEANKVVEETRRAAMPPGESYQ